MQLRGNQHTQKITRLRFYDDVKKIDPTGGRELLYNQ